MDIEANTLDSSSYVDDFNREIALDSSPSFDAVDLQLYELVDRRLNPWLQLDHVTQLLKKQPKATSSLHRMVDEAVTASSKDQQLITLTCQQFQTVAVPTLARRTAAARRPQPATTSSLVTAARPDQGVVLVHYSHRLRQLLDVKQLSISL